MNNHTLYITFDGLTDPLGQSQILPYLKGLAANGYHITIISCEKTKRLQDGEQKVRSQLKGLSIKWQYLVYREEGGIFSRFSYIRKLKTMANIARKENKIALVHCRSYLAALIGLRFKKRYHIPFLFDMRGLWADERMDGKIWSKTNPLHLLFYRYFKRKEKQFFHTADAVVSLTHVGLVELERLYPKEHLRGKTVVIPCCTDTRLFDPNSVADHKPAELLSEGHILVYTGSIGTWYYTKEMIDCTLVWKKLIPDIKLLIVTRDQEELQNILSRYDAEARALIITASSNYDTVPHFLKLAKAAIFFIKPAYSKIASSPTKMAECWSMGLPIITNHGVGDNDLFFEKYKGGILVSGFNDNAYLEACKKYLRLENKGEHYRQVALDHFDHENGVRAYSQLYKKIGLNQDT